MTIRVLVFRGDKRIMVKSNMSGMDAIEFMAKCEKEGLTAVLL